MKRQPIHIDNYEEYFLLYVDHELTAAEMAEVDSFVALHPELNIVLQMLLDTTLDPEEVSMEGKEHLFRSEQPGLINSGNVEEFQVLLLDEELDPENAAQLALFHANNEAAKKNFDWLRKTKLPYENIVFPHKERLYRTARKPASIISIQWYRYAAAAAILITAGLLWISSQNTTGDLPQPIAQTGDQGTIKQIPGKTTVQNKTGLPSGEKETGTEDKDLAGNDKAYNAADVRNPNTGNSFHTANNNAPRSDMRSNRNTATPVLATGRQDWPNRELQKNVARQEQVTAPENENALAALDKTNSKPVEIIDRASEEYVTAPNPLASQAAAPRVKTNYVSDALTGETEPEDEDGYADGKQRKGFRGIVRKANRIYNKMTNPDVDKPVVKVANFEIGLPR